jgi:hypothetical protein
MDLNPYFMKDILMQTFQKPIEIFFNILNFLLNLILCIITPFPTLFTWKGPQAQINLGHYDSQHNDIQHNNTQQNGK